MRAALLLVSLFIFKSITNAQNIYRIAGEVRTTNGAPLQSATITCIPTKDTTNKILTVTSEDGKFQFTRLLKNRYILTISHTGYTSYTTKPIETDSQHPVVNLPVIILQSFKANTLSEVVVTSQKKMVEVKIDRTIINVQAMIGAAGADALEVLKRSPGVSVDMNGGISLDGKNGVLVLIDDRPTYMSAPDLADYLRSLPAGALDRLELMSNPSSRYEANGGAIINIVLKKSRVAGFTGNTSASYTQGIYSRKNISLNLNYRRGYSNIFTNLSASDDESFTDDLSQRYFYKADRSPDHTVIVNNRLVNTTNSWNGRIGMDQKLSANTNAGILITGNVRPKIDRSVYNANRYDSLLNIDSVNTGFTNTDGRWKSFGLNVNLQHKFDSAGKTLSLDLDHIRYATTGAQTSGNDGYTGGGSLLKSDRIRQDLPARVQIYSLKTDLTIPLRKGGRFDAGVKTSYVRNDNEADWFDGSGAANTPDYTKSNHFVYTEAIQAGYVTLAKDYGRFAAQAGLRVENSFATGHQLSNPAIPDSSFSRNYTQAFPSVFLLYKLDKKGNQTVVLRYSTRTRRPGYQQLNPFLFYVDRYSYTAGNTSLLPQYNYNLALEYHFKQYFALNAGYNRETQITYPVTSPLPAISSDVFVTRPQNAPKRESVALIPNLNLSPFKWWNLNMHALLLYFFHQGSINGIALPDYHINEFEVSNQFRFKENWSAELTGFFPGKQSFGQTQSQPVYRIGAGIQKNLFNNNATIRLKIDDLFNTSGNFHTRTIAINNADFYTARMTDARRLGLSFTYRFGKLVNARKSKHDKGGAEDETGRVN